jgi:alpha-tubulin suppressor-like RCC1 family protein
MKTVYSIKHLTTSSVLRRLGMCATSVALSLLLGACGGGGGGDGAVTPPGSITPPGTVTPPGIVTPPGTVTPPTVSVSIGGSPHAVANTVYGYQAGISGATSGDFVWNWGDGTPNSNGANVSKVWGKHGSFTNTLNATVDGQAVSASRSARVARPISAASDHTCALADVDLRDDNGATGFVVCWGVDEFVGQGIGEGAKVRIKPVIVLNENNKPLTNVVAIHTANARGCALKADGTVACWRSGQVAKPLAGFTGAVAIALGANHDCALQAGGSVMCVGSNDIGQLGGGVTGAPQTTPVSVAGLTDAVAISAGFGHTCALRSSGSVACWGANNEGQLGDGSLVSSATMLAVKNLSDAVAITAGLQHSCALRAGGAVVCWGNNAKGQLGSGTQVNNSTTTLAVSGLGDAVAISASERSQHTCALRAGGTMVCWGFNAVGQLGNGTTTIALSPVAVSELTDVVAFSAGALHTCAIKSDASAFCWGLNDLGQLGDTKGFDNVSALPSSLVTANSSVPSKVVEKLWNFVPNAPITTPTGTVTVPPITTTTTIACTDTPTALVTPTALLDAGGGVSFNMTGFVRGVANTIYSYLGSVVNSTATNIVWTWGDGSANSSGTSVDKIWTKPGVYNASLQSLIGGVSATGNKQVAMAGEPISASKSFRHTCALKPDGTVACWGDNSIGQLGNGSTAVSNFTGTQTVAGLTGVIALTTGAEHTCALKTGGSVVCWGGNSLNQLGDGTAVGKTVPVAVSNLTGVTAIAAGKFHTCAIKSTPSVTLVCWGSNSARQLGDTTNTSSAIPKTAIVLTGNLVVAVTAGDEHTCALINNGTVKCFGRNDKRQMGIGSATPTQLNTVSGLTNVVAISAGSAHTCALKADRTVACWGLAGSGQNGNNIAGTEEICGVICLPVNSTPVAVFDLTDAVAISAGNAHTCALRANGNIACWGDGALGQLGNDNLVKKNSPVAVACLSNAVSVSAGLAHTCALKADGSSACWGNNSFGQLGDGTTATTKKIPSSVVGGKIYWN